MDGSMPELDGVAATRRIREAERASGRPPARIVALTAQVRGIDADAWMAAGADRHLSKPFSVARLAETLAALVPPAAAAPDPAPDRAPLFDEEALGLLRDMGERTGRDVIGRIWRLFRANATAAAARIDAETGRAAPDPTAVAAAAHALKSMSLSAGASALAAACERLEAAGRAREAARFPPLAAAVAEQLAATLAEMDGRAASEPAAPPSRKPCARLRRGAAELVPGFAPATRENRNLDRAS
jgi:two-component system sensor histidine kinase BarA